MELKLSKSIFDQWNNKPRLFCRPFDEPVVSKENKYFVCMYQMSGHESFLGKRNHHLVSYLVCDRFQLVHQWSKEKIIIIRNLKRFNKFNKFEKILFDDTLSGIKSIRGLVSQNVNSPLTCIRFDAYRTLVPLICYWPFPLRIWLSSVPAIADRQIQRSHSCARSPFLTSFKKKQFRRNYIN